MLNFISVNNAQNSTPITIPILMIDDLDIIIDVTAKRIDEARTGIIDTTFPIIEDFGNMSKSIILGRGRTVMYILYEWNDDTEDQYLVSKYYIGEIHICNHEEVNDDLNSLMMKILQQNTGSPILNTQKTTSLRRLRSIVDEKSFSTITWLMKNLDILIKMSDSKTKEG